MNWSRAKTILIIFFICTNIFLLFILLFFMDSTPRVSEEIAAFNGTDFKGKRYRR